MLISGIGYNTSDITNPFMPEFKDGKWIYRDLPRDSFIYSIIIFNANAESVKKSRMECDVTVAIADIKDGFRHTSFYHRRGLFRTSYTKPKQIRALIRGIISHRNNEKPIERMPEKIAEEVLKDHFAELRKLREVVDAVHTNSEGGSHQ